MMSRSHKQFLEAKKGAQGRYGQGSYYIDRLQVVIALSETFRIR